MSKIRVGIIGLGANCRSRHVPGLRECADVDIVGVVNRRAESTAAVARQFDIPKTYEHWEQLVADPEVDAVVIGTWPYLHCPITVVALNAGKHVLTEARMACNAAEARQMYQASQEHPQLVAQIVPSPLGFHAMRVVRSMVDDGFLGQLREVVAIAANDAFADPSTPLHWRQSEAFSGKNSLVLGIIHEALSRWVPETESVLAQCQTFITSRTDPDSGQLASVDRPDSLHVLSTLRGGALGIYHLTSAVHFGAGVQIHLYGSDGTIKYELAPQARLLAGRSADTDLAEVQVPQEQAYSWRVEQDFIDAIRGENAVELTDFATGVRYMEFTEAVAQAPETGSRVVLPLSG